jgi:hypothetical protein
MTKFHPDFGYIILEEKENAVLVSLSKFNYFDFIDFLEENNFAYQENNDYSILVEDSLEELFEELIEYNLVLYLTEYGDQNISFISEGSAKRKIVIRKGKRKVVFQCQPGQKKLGKRCVKRPQKDIAKLKRRAKRAARKSKSKKRSALRKRKLSLRKRASIDRKKSK